MRRPPSGQRVGDRFHSHSPRRRLWPRGSMLSDSAWATLLAVSRRPRVGMPRTRKRRRTRPLHLVESRLASALLRRKRRTARPMDRPSLCEPGPLEPDCSGEALPTPPIAPVLILSGLVGTAHAACPSKWLLRSQRLAWLIEPGPRVEVLCLTPQGARGPRRARAQTRAQPRDRRRPLGLPPVMCLTQRPHPLLSST